MNRRLPGADRRSSRELAILVSAFAAVFAYALHRFAGVGEVPLVLGTLVGGSLVGWNQPALRAAPRRSARPATVVATVRRRRT